MSTTEVSQDKSENSDPSIVPLPLGSRHVFVTHAESPDEIWIRDERLDNMWNREEPQISEMLKEAMTNPPLSLNEEIIGANVAIKIIPSFYRGIVLDAKGQNEILTCRLLDYGKVVVVPKTDVRILPLELQQKNMFCVCTKLANVVATGTGDPGKWSQASAESIKMLLEGKDLYFKQTSKHSIDTGYCKKYEGIYLFKEKVTDGPFSPEYEKIINVNDLLSDEGLAMAKSRDNTLSSAGDTTDPFSTSSSASMSSPNTSMNMMKEHKISWPLPKMPSTDTSKDFIARITFIDDMGQIYVQQETNVEKANAMSYILTEAHTKIPPDSEDQVWYPGDPVIAMYDDQVNECISWNRGIVTKVYAGGKIKVLFIDYGETVKLDPTKNECHKCIMFDDVPILALRCKLENIVPVNEGGNYHPDFIFRMRKLLTDKQVRVQITRRYTKRFPLAVIMHLIEFDSDSGHNGNIARIFVQEGAAKIMDSREDWYDPKDVQKQEKLAFYIQPTLDPKDFTEEFYNDLIEISETYPKVAPFMNFGIDLMVPAKFALLMNDQIYVQLGTNFEHLKEVPPAVENQLKKMKEDFMILHEKIQSKAAFLLNCPVRYGLKNFPYLVKSEIDNVWYRCVIYNQKEKTYVTVRLIDSGQLQINDIRQLKMMPFGFMKFPRQAILIKKTNLTNFQEEWLKERELAIKINKENMVQLFYYENHVWKEM